MTRRGRLQHGMTLVEVVVGTLVACLALGSAWALFALGERHRVWADRKFQGVGEALFLSAPLGRDAAALVWDGPEPVTIDGGERPGLSFLVLDAGSSDPARGDLRVIRIRYWLDRSACAIFRQAGSGPVDRLEGAFEDLRFRRTVPPDFLSLPPHQAPATPPRSAGLLDFLVTCIPRELASVPAGRRPASARTVLWGTVPLRIVNARIRHQFWMCTTVPGGTAAGT